MSGSFITAVHANLQSTLAGGAQLDKVKTRVAQEFGQMTVNANSVLGKSFWQRRAIKQAFGEWAQGHYYGGEREKNERWRRG
jgi:hypothetical protein